MNIVMVSAYDCFYPGGVGEHIRSLSAALRRCGHTVTILGPTNIMDTSSLPNFIRTGRSRPLPGNGSRAHVGLGLRLPSHPASPSRRSGSMLLITTSPYFQHFRCSCFERTGVPTSRFFTRPVTGALPIVAHARFSFLTFDGSTCALQ